MKLILKVNSNSSYKGGHELALCDEDGERLPHHTLNISQTDADGIVTITTTFKVDGKQISIAPAWPGK